MVAGPARHTKPSAQHIVAAAICIAVAATIATGAVSISLSRPSWVPASKPTVAAAQASQGRPEARDRRSHGPSEPDHDEQPSSVSAASPVTESRERQPAQRHRTRAARLLRSLSSRARSSISTRRRENSRNTAAGTPSISNRPRPTVRHHSQGIRSRTSAEAPPDAPPRLPTCAHTSRAPQATSTDHLPESCSLRQRACAAEDRRLGTGGGGTPPRRTPRREPGTRRCAPGA